MPQFFPHGIEVINTDTISNLTLLLLALNLIPRLLLVHLKLQDSNIKIQKLNTVFFWNSSLKLNFIRRSDHFSCCLPLRFGKLSWLQTNLDNSHPFYADTKAQFHPTILWPLAPTAVHKIYWSIYWIPGETDESSMKYLEKMWQFHQYFRCA